MPWSKFSICLKLLNSNNNYWRMLDQDRQTMTWRWTVEELKYTVNSTKSLSIFSSYSGLFLFYPGSNYRWSSHMVVLESNSNTDNDIINTHTKWHTRKAVLSIHSELILWYQRRGDSKVWNVIFGGLNTRTKVALSSVSHCSGAT